jgi:hypothetical protein
VSFSIFLFLLPSNQRGIIICNQVGISWQQRTFCGICGIYDGMVQIHFRIPNCYRDGKIIIRNHANYNFWLSFVFMIKVVIF